jgi:adenylylsulfate kinase
MFHERHSRTFYKTITWFIVGFLVTFVVLMFFVKDWKWAIGDALLIQTIKLIFFYLHERVWNKSNFGQELKIKD